jgi:Lar family restriction alleviation protein
MTDNKPCPFCGDTDISYIPAVLGVISQAYCESCHARGPQTSDSDHFDLWNTRHTPWQPIETAPKDSTRFLVFLKNGDFEIVAFHICNEEKCPWADNEGWVLNSDPCNGVGEHISISDVCWWMPLPEGLDTHSDQL